jgi:HSP20 family molecular chaperone IbpA
MIPVPASGQAGGSLTTPARSPFYTIQDKGESLTLLVELPGADGKTIDLELSASTLSINAGLIPLAKSGFGPYAGTLQLPMQVESGNADAHYGEGLLVLTLPKIASLRMHKVNVRVEQ